jgi:hypothetical protein
VFGSWQGSVLVTITGTNFKDRGSVTMSNGVVTQACEAPPSGSSGDPSGVYWKPDGTRIQVRLWLLCLTSRRGHVMEWSSLHNPTVYGTTRHRSRVQFHSCCTKRAVSPNTTKILVRCAYHYQRASSKGTVRRFESDLPLRLRGDTRKRLRRQESQSRCLD